MRRLAVIAVLLLTLVVAVAQRKVTPVASTDELKPVTKEELKEIRRQEKLKFLRTDSLTLDSLRRDSIERASKRVYRPTLMGVTLGVNFWGPLMRALGQDYGDGDVWAAVNIRNRYIPVAEVGFGQADCSPEDGNFTYKSKLALYGKIGMNYNFLYAKDPKYQLYAGVRFAASKFNYDVTGITVDNGYWGKDPSTFDLRGQSSSAFWGEAVVGIHVFRQGFAQFAAVLYPGLWRARQSFERKFVGGIHVAAPSRQAKERGVAAETRRSGR